MTSLLHCTWAFELTASAEFHFSAACSSKAMPYAYLRLPVEPNGFKPLNGISAQQVAALELPL